MKKVKVVYIHRRKDTGEPFYVGMGTLKRAYIKGNRSKEWKRIVKEAGGYDIDIVQENMTIFEAWDLERELITKYGRFDLGTGILVNQTGGGGGTIDVSNDTRELLSKQSKENWDNPEYRNNIISHIEDKWKNPDHIELMRQKSREMWENPTYREHMKEKRIETWTRPEYREHMTQMTRDMWQDEEFRKKHSEVVTSPESRKKRSESAKKKFQENPDLLLKIKQEQTIIQREKNRGKGIRFEQRTKKYRAMICVDGKQKHIGRYDTYEEALQARLEAEEKYWGVSLDTPVP